MARPRDYHELTELGRARRLRTLVAAALDEYDLAPSRIRLITNETNGVFRVDTPTGRYVVRVGLSGEVGHSPAQVTTEVAWLDAIARDTDISVPRVIRTRNGAPFVTLGTPSVTGDRNVVLFSWLPGRLLGDDPPIAGVFALGATMARLHDHGAGFVVPDPAALITYDSVLPFEETDHLLRAGEELMPRRRTEMFEAARRRVSTDIASRDRAGLQLLHGDLHPWNVKWSRGRMSTFDFEDLMLGWRVQDVATTLYYFHGDQKQEALFDAFEAGYRSVEEWPAPDPGEIETFLMGRALVLANYVLASDELAPNAGTYLGWFEARISAVLDGRRYVSDH